jgi:hypothetical protein
MGVASVKGKDIPAHESVLSVFNCGLVEEHRALDFS